MRIDCESPIMRKESIDMLLKADIGAGPKQITDQISSLKDMKVELEMNEKVLDPKLA